MKKTILIFAVLALLLPSGALAATEFSLGGFIKLSTFWDSTQNSFSPTVFIQRNNDPSFHHGDFTMSAQETRLNFTIKGPNIWGATTTGFIEIDFDALSDNLISGTSGVVGGTSPTNNYIPRLRHAMFRLNWPETELMFGQYWGMLSEYSPETAGDSQFSYHGFANQRVPQIRVTQKFLNDWTVAGAICKPYDPSSTDTNFYNQVGPNSAQTTSSYLTPQGAEGRSSETPMLQGKLAYEKDLWGKAAFYGRPRGFTAQVVAAWQRTRYRDNTAGATFNTFGENAFGLSNANSFQRDQQYLDPWCVQGTLFIPVIPTYSANLAGTASLTAQWYIGQGVSFVGGGRDQDNSWFEFKGVGAAFNAGHFPFAAYYYDRRLTNQFGGYLQGQYWFTNQWYLNLAWGLLRNYGFSQATSPQLVSAANPAGYKYASNNDQEKMWSEFDVTLWYRPIEALKFGLQYTYERSDFLQKLNNPVLTAVAPVQTNTPQPSSGATNVGESHRIQFAAFMFF